MNLFALLLVAAGLFSVCGAAFDWDFFMNSRRARFFVMIFGRTGARVFYTILGVAIMVLGLIMTFGGLRDAA